MGQPEMRGMLVAGPLGDVSIQYRNKSYIGDRVFPIADNVPLDAKIARYLKGAWFRDEAGIRAPGTRARRGGYPTDYISVALDEYAFAKEVTDEDRRIAAMKGAPPLQPDTDAIEFTADKIDLKKEILIAALIIATDWSGAGAGGEDAEGGWAAGGSNTFLADVSGRIETIRSKTGLRANRLAIDHGTYESLKSEATLLDRIKYTQRGVMTKEMIAAILELDEVLVGEAIKSTAAEAADGSDFTAANVWEVNAGKGMGFLFYAPPRIGLRVPSAGIQARAAYENGQARRSSTWRENAEHQDVYETAEQTDIVVTGTDLGFMWKDTLAT
jgi:hypothetical protein